MLLADNVIFPGAPDFLEYVRGSGRFECSHFSSYLEYSQVVDGLEKVIYKGPGGPVQDPPPRPALKGEAAPAL